MPGSISTGATTYFFNLGDLHLTAPSSLQILRSSHSAFSSVGLLIGAASRNTVGEPGKRAHIAALYINYDEYRARTLVLKNQPASSSSSTVAAAEGERLEDSGEAVAEVPVSSPSTPRNAPRAIPRTIPPLIPSHDIPRGIIHAIQSAFSYTLMLVVM